MARRYIYNYCAILMVNILTFLKYLRGIFKTDLKNGTVHYAVIQSIYDAFVMVDGDLDLIRLEMCLSTATGKWLDYWGDFFTVHRKPNETDSAYSRRIIEYVIRPKTTIPALKDYIVEFLNDKYGTSYTQDDVDIREPWKELAKYSHKGALSHTSRMYSGNYYTHATIDISIPESLTQELINLVRAVKAAGVQVLWSFFNSYDIISDFSDADDVWIDYHRHIQSMAINNLYSGLILSHSSVNPYLSGRREIWKEYYTTYYWYAKVLDKETDQSIIITKADLIALLDHWEITEIKYKIKDTGTKLSQNALLSGSYEGATIPNTYLSGAFTASEEVTEYFQFTDEVLEMLKFVDDWLTLSYKGKLSTKEGILYNFEASQELIYHLNQTLEKFKQGNINYWNALQPPIIIAEHLAMWYVAQNRNWLMDTPTMSMEDFHTLWEFDENYPNHTLNDIYSYQDTLPVNYLTFGDVYQPPIVRSDFPWYWTPIQDYQWLWASETLTCEDLDAIYRMKISSIPEYTEIVTTEVKHLENAFTLNESTLTPQRITLEVEYISSSEESLQMSSSKGRLSVQKPSGQEAKAIYTRVEHTDVDEPKHLSGTETTITKEHKLVSDTITLDLIMNYENNQQVYNPNEEIKYSTRGFNYPIDYVQAPIQVGELAMWLITVQGRQLWNTPTISNTDIMQFWDFNSSALPFNFERWILGTDSIYQPPLIITDMPINSTVLMDEDCLFRSEVLEHDDLEYIYQLKRVYNLEGTAKAYGTTINKLSVSDLLTESPTLEEMIAYDEKAVRLYDGNNIKLKYSLRDIYQAPIEIH